MPHCRKCGSEIDDVAFPCRACEPVLGAAKNSLLTLRKALGDDAVTYPFRDGDTWTCVCGEESPFDEPAKIQKCPRCDRNRDFVLDKFGKSLAEVKAIQANAGKVTISELDLPRLVACEVCQREISTMSSACPHCGHPRTPASHRVTTGVSSPRGEGRGSGLATAGVMVAVIAAIAFVAAVAMDTSVATGVPGIGRVENMGLMNRQQNYVIASAAGLVFGALLILASKLKS